MSVGARTPSLPPPLFSTSPHHSFLGITHGGLPSCFLILTLGETPHPLKGRSYLFPLQNKAFRRLDPEFSSLWKAFIAQESGNTAEISQNVQITAHNHTHNHPEKTGVLWVIFIRGGCVGRCGLCVCV